MSLLDLQQAFSVALFDQAEQAVLERVKGRSGEAKNQRLDIHRNNVFYSLSNALADLYPVVKRLVGKQFFNAMAKEYIRHSPPRSAAMVHFGENFALFMESFEHTQRLPWLADVARVELAWHQAYHAADQQPLQAADFPSESAELIGQAQLRLHPSLRLLRSAYPVLKIWTANQHDESGDAVVDLDAGGVNVCVYRPGFTVYLREADEATYTLLLSLQQGKKLAIALENAEQKDTNLTTAEILANCIKNGFFAQVIGS